VTVPAADIAIDKLMQRCFHLLELLVKNESQNDENKAKGLFFKSKELDSQTTAID
jgi:hypothetical protein